MSDTIYLDQKRLAKIFDIEYKGDVEIESCVSRASLSYGENNIMSKIRTNGGSFKKGVSIPKTEEWKKKISKSLTGSKNGNYKKPEASKHLNEIKLSCPHCGMVTTRGNLARWHNDNCKKK